MGTGPAFAIAAAMYCRDKLHTKSVICVESDPAIGFSGMEIETMLRYGIFIRILLIMPLVLSYLLQIQPPYFIVAVNNNRIYSGLDQEKWDVVRNGPIIAYYFITILLKARWLQTVTLLFFHF